MNVLLDYMPRGVNTGSWLSTYTLNELLLQTPGEQIVLPICSVGTPYAELASLARFVLPPLFHEALDDELKQAMLARIQHCFPHYQGTKRQKSGETTLEIVELAPRTVPPPWKPRILSFSVDTAVEQHGPHLPLATDTLQSYAVLARLAEEVDGFIVGPPVEYGHLTWGLPFGMSIDLTPPLVTRYVTGYANAMQKWLQPEFMYVVDVHGSIVHRNAIVEGLQASDGPRWSFRWLYDPIVEFAGDRGDQHAGGVETALVQRANPALVDPNWWPDRIQELTEYQMDLELAVEMTPDLDRFIKHAETYPLNGIVGDVQNYYNVDAELMFERMLAITRADLTTLTESNE